MPLASCAVFDPAQPIEIVPAEDATAREVATLEAAGECWNLAFGTQLVVTREPETEQAVFVGYSDLTCIGAWGTFTPGVPARIDVCPPGRYQGPQTIADVTYFMIVSHELGHAAGIRAEGEGNESVTGRNMGAYAAERQGGVLPAFTEEDVAMFQAAAPDFAITMATGCRAILKRGDAASGVRCYCSN